MIKKLLMCMSAVMMLTAGMQDSYGDDFRLKYGDYEQLCDRLDDFILPGYACNRLKKKIHEKDPATGEHIDLKTGMPNTSAIRIKHIKQLIDENCPQADVLKEVKSGDKIRIYYGEEYGGSTDDVTVRVIGDKNYFPCRVDFEYGDYLEQCGQFAGSLFNSFGDDHDYDDGEYHIPHDAFQQLVRTLGDSGLAEKLKQIKPGNIAEIKVRFAVD